MGGGEVFGVSINVGIHQKSLFQLLGFLKATAWTCIIIEHFEHLNALSSSTVMVRSAVPFRSR